jgi:hypothetical protein
MKPHSVSRFAIFSVAFLTFIGLTIVVAGEPGPHRRHVGLVEDWSHRHLVFSNPGTYDQVKNDPAAYSKWIRIMYDDRYIMQQMKRDAAANGSGASEADPTAAALANRTKDSKQNAFHRDWGMSLLAGGTVGDEMFPAKFTFDVNATPSCTNDYVAFNTSLIGSSTKPSIIVFDELYSTQGSTGGFCNQNGPSVKWAYNTNLSGDTTGAVVTSPVLSLDGTKVAYVETRTNAYGGAILHLLKWKPGTTATVEGTLTNPATPDTTLTAGTAWSTCPAANSCVANITFNGAQPDSNSSPYYNYNDDTLYVGDNNGVLHKFTGVLNGTPAEVVTCSSPPCTTAWPLTVHSGSVLSSPILDLASGNIFVGDASNRLSYVMEVGSTTGACAGSGNNPPCLGTTTQALGGAIVDSPLVDSSAQTVFAFEGTDTTDSGRVFQFNTALTTASKKIASIGYYAGSSYHASHVHVGAFDDAYFASGTATGHLFVCGKDQSTSRYDSPAIHRITITNGAMNTSTDGYYTLVSASGEECSPVTEFYNTTTATDWIFFSVGNFSSTPSSCSSDGAGCLLSLNLTALGTSWPPSAVTAGVPTPAGPVNGTTSTNESSTSGIVVDNVGPDTWQANTNYSVGNFIIDSNGNAQQCTTAGKSGATQPANWGTTTGATTTDNKVTWTYEGLSQAASLYFSYTSNSTSSASCNGTNGVGCAVKLTQSGLQ